MVASSPQRRANARPRQLRCAVRVGHHAQQFQGIGPGQIVEGLQRGREVLPQRRAHPQQLSLPIPDQVLMGPPTCSPTGGVHPATSGGLHRH